MTAPTDAELQALGLDSGVLGGPDPIPWPAEEAAHGKGAVEGVLLAAAVLGPFHAVPLHQGVAQVRFEISAEHPEVWKAIAPPGRRLEVRTPDDATERVRVISSDGSIVAVRGTARVTLAEAGEDRLVHSREGAFDARTVDAGATVARWLAESPAGEIDPWLRGTVERRLAFRDGWHTVVAVGLLARLAGAPASSWSFRQPPRAMLAARRWARETLTPAQAEWIDRLLAAEVHSQLAVLDRLSETMACDEPDWQSDVLGVCIARDDIESSRIVLAEHGTADDGLDTTLGALDTDGVRFMQTLPVALSLRDARLRRAATFDPSAWWVALSGDESSDPGQ